MTAFQAAAILPDILKFDVVHEVEKFTGTRVAGGGDDVALLALAVSFDHGERKRRALQEVGDTYYGMPIAEYRAIVESYGFEMVLETPFDGSGGEETHFIYAHRDGLLLSVDTYRGKRVNGGNVYYTWKSSPGIKDRHELTSSGRWLDRDRYTIWQGYHDCREAIVYHLDALRTAGTFLSTWPQEQFIWLLHYMDTEAEGYDYEAINAERISRLPEWVQRMICRANDDCEESC